MNSVQLWLQMKPIILASGIIILVIGVGGYSWIETHVSDCQSSLERRGPLFNYLAELCLQLKLIQFAIIGITTLGFGIIIYGAITKDKVALQGR